MRELRMLLILLSLGATSYAQPLQSLNLSQAKAIALKHHPEILSARYRLKASQEATKEAQSFYYPQVGINAVRAFAGSNTRISAPISGINNSLVLDRASYGATATQLITDFGRVGYLVDSARAIGQVYGARSLSIRDRILFEATRAYYNVLRAQKILALAEKTLKTRQLLLEQIQALDEAHLKSDLDASIALQSVDEARLLLLQAQGNLDSAQAELSQALGYEDEKIFALEEAREINSPVGDIKTLLEKAKDQNPELQALRNEVMAARQQYLAEKAAHYPSINAFGYTGQNPTRDKDSMRANDSTAGISMSIPVFTGGRLTATQERARYQTKAAQRDLKTKENQLMRDVRLARNDTQTTYKNIPVTAELSANAVKALELTEARYKLGLSSIVDLAQAQLAQTQSEISHTNATYDYLICRALLAFHVGSMESVEPSPSK